MKASVTGEPSRHSRPAELGLLALLASARSAGRGFLARLLPEDPAVFRGPASAAAALAVVNLAGTARSAVHLLAPDSGAGTIAAMPVEGDTGRNTVALLAQWGGAQLLEAGVGWVILARYRGLIPLMWAIVTGEQAIRVIVGRHKPLTTTGRKPPGALSGPLLPVCALCLAWSLKDRQRSAVTAVTAVGEAHPTT
jgi:hypothetical protein